MSKFTNSSAALVLFLCIFLVVAWNCTSPERPAVPNTTPITRLANIPPPDTFIVSSNPRLTLAWIGDDPDGYVIAFRYRWSFRLNANSPVEYKPWTTVLNSWNAVGGGVEGKDNFALMTDAEVSNLPNVYHYFAILLNGLSDEDAAVLALGDSLVIADAHVWASNYRTNRYPVHTKPTSGTFIFDSQDSLNPHEFEVLAVDNAAAEGVPAVVSFGTPRVTPPHAEIVGFPNDTVMVLNELTETFTGIRFDFRGFDPNSRTIDYSWVVDRDQWPPDSIPWSEFSQNTVAYVTAHDFPNPFATNHTIYLRSRNEFGSIDTLGYFLRQRFDNNNTPILDSLGRPIKDTVRAQKDFLTIYPPFKQPGYQQRILLLNLSYGWPDETPAHPSQLMVTQYYLDMLNTIGKGSIVDTFTVVDNKLTNIHIFPGRGILSQYSTVILVGDAMAFNGAPLADLDFSWRHGQSPAENNWGEREKTLLDYVNIGGKMIISAWNLPYSGNAGGLSLLTRTVCHIQNVTDPEKDRDTTGGGFIGARGEKGYPGYIGIDTTKLDPGWHGTLFYLHPGRPYGFGEIIFRYDRLKDTLFFPNSFPPFRVLENLTIGVRYLGVTYDAIYFGFPLYYMEQQGSTEALRQALSDINELNR